VIVSLCGCSDKITEGEVYEKEYREATTTMSVFPLVISNGKTTTTTMIPYFIHYPERYVIHIKAFVDAEWVTEDFYVSKEVYDSVNIGDMFAFDEERGDLKDEPYTKERAENEKSD
jgi:hypothetical protein